MLSCQVCVQGFVEEAHSEDLGLSQVWLLETQGEAFRDVGLRFM